MDIIKKIELFEMGGATSGATVTGNVGKNLAQGSVDVVGGNCPEGMVYDKKKKTCVPKESK